VLVQTVKFGQNLPPRYCERARAGKDEDWIGVYVRGEYGLSSRSFEGVPLWLGVEFGLTPASVIGQKLFDGRWLILDELVSEDCGIVRFAELLTAYLVGNYRDFGIDLGWGDLAGNQRVQTDDRRQPRDSLLAQMRHAAQRFCRWLSLQGDPFRPFRAIPWTAPPRIAFPTPTVRGNTCCGVAGSIMW
jgi:hypothetical protein